MRRKQLAKRVAVAALSATMALSTGVPAFAATVTSVKVNDQDQDVMDSNSTAGKIADAFGKIDTNSEGKWGNSADKQEYITQLFAQKLVDAKIFTDWTAANSAISVKDDNTYVVTLDDGKKYTVSQTDGVAVTTNHEETAKAAEIKAALETDASKAVSDALKKLDLTYNTSLTKGQNEKNVKDAAEEALSALDPGLHAVSATYTDGVSGAASTYTIVISGTFTAGDNKGKTPYTEYTLAATSKDATVLEDAATALNTYKTESADAATTQDEISEGVQDVLDKANNDDFDDITFTIENFKKTDDKITADVVLKLGDATKTVKLNKAIDKTGLAGTALSAIKSENLKTVAANNFTTDTDGVATGLDSDALAAAVKKVAEEALRGAGYTNAVANVSITTYEADKDSDNGYAVGSITVTRNGETSAAKIFTINADLKDGSYKYSTAASQGTGIVRDASILKKSDNQKIASVVKTLDKALEKDATLGIKNTANKNVPLTKNQLLAKAKDNEKIKAHGTEGVDLKYAVSDDGKTVDTDKTDDKAIVVKSYTAPTTEAEGTAVITVNYNIIKDEKTAGSTTASDYVSASHDITLTFPKLSARKTSAIDVKDSTSKIDLTLNATDTTDAKDYFDFNGNSALTWTSSDESVFTVDKDGNLSPVGIGEATLTVAVADNDSVKATKTVKVTGTTAFKDVQNRKAWYYNAISTLAGKKNAKGNAIVQGVAKDEFGISTPITRAQFVTFLYRLADEPAVSTTTKFTDVDTNAYYAKAVAWAAQKGIVYGKTDTIFAPNDTVSRAEAVTMLYRYKGEPDYNSNITTTFSDVARGAYYYDAVQWAAGTVTYGKSATTFAPGDACDRAEGITMIYRAEPQSK